MNKEEIKQQAREMAERDDESLVQLTRNAHDIGTISGVLRGIELTATLLPNQKRAITHAIESVDRLFEYNKARVNARTNAMQEKESGE